jgi:CRP-like cAMP-binding protein
MKCRWEEYQPGERIVERDTADDALLILARGRVRVVASADMASGKTVRYVEPGEVFGEVAPIDRGRRWATAVTCESCLVVVFPPDLLWDLMKSRPRIMATMLRRLAKTVREISPSALAFLYHTV